MKRLLLAAVLTGLGVLPGLRTARAQAVPVYQYDCLITYTSPPEHYYLTLYGAPMSPQLDAYFRGGGILCSLDED